MYERPEVGSRGSEAGAVVMFRRRRTHRIGTVGVTVLAVALLAPAAAVSAEATAWPTAATPASTGADVVEVELAPDAGMDAGVSVDLGVALDLPPAPTPETSEPSGVVPDPTGAATVGGASGDSESILSASGSTSGFAVVGVTWDRGSASEGTSVAIRSRTGETWTDWEPVQVDVDGADGAGVPGAQWRDGTDPVAVGIVDEVEVAVRGEGGVLPAHPELAIIDPDAHPGARTTVSTVAGPDSARISGGVWHPQGQGGSVSTAAVAGPGALSAAAVPRPEIHSRADWGADESLMTWAPQPGRVRGAIVHHTVNANNYTADQVPSIMRGIYTYHAVSRGWGDIGYNVLVDRFGRAWQGRAGGVDREIVGAHATGWNSEWFGISVIGDFQQAAPSSAIVDAVAFIIGWKFSLHGVQANSFTIRGHRDVGQTSCPGDYLYARIPEIRAKAVAWQGDGSDRTLVHDVTGDGRADLALRTGSSIEVASSSARGWESPKQVGNGWTGSRTIAPGDFTGDGIPDLMLRSGGSLFLYPGTASGGWAARQEVGIASLAEMDLVVGGHDWTGDGATDLLARRSADGTLWLYAGNGRGGVAEPRKIGIGWASMSLIQMIGQLADGRPALVARDGSGTLYTYVGDGSGGFSTRVVVGPGWSVMNMLVGVGDMDDDGRNDLVARGANGDFLLYPGTGTGTFANASRIGIGWGSFTAILSAGREGSGQDVYAVTAAGVLLRYAYRGGGFFDQRLPSGVSGSDVTEVITPGDWNGDGRADLITRRTNGDLWLYPGLGSGSFASAGTKIGIGWGSFAQVISGGNWLGTGVPTLIALDRNAGRIWLYPGNGRGGFGSAYMLASGVGNVDSIINAGRWSGGTVPDLLTRVAGTGALQLRVGNGGALLGDPTQIGSGWQGMQIVGAGDVDGDGRPDLAASRGTTLLLYPGNGTGGFLRTQTIGAVPSGAVLS